ncbi:hypothetical protein PHLGIDRAFT_217219 [Phlebiopsis gigantea 11061_1 CR5-6]|uniref:Uncharacterized protein n=1 Tax=Phlebiopsis gigantea (strain 11061_1 CR5-6) TaxID=745531 RepID=A0A0C3S661_PHLG1|nr:hypothetical protein PHLGIDRAFT_217219 [Phlebiopsis gigantea 11061_1 CR5-6]
MIAALFTRLRRGQWRRRAMCGSTRFHGRRAGCEVRKSSVAVAWVLTSGADRLRLLRCAVKMHLLSQCPLLDFSL